MAGLKFGLPRWAWMTDGAFQSKVAEWSNKVEALGKDAEKMDELGLKMGTASLKTALDAKNRADITKVAGKVEKIAGDVKDAGLKGKAEKLAKDIKDSGGRTFGKMFAGGNLLTALYALIGFLVLAALGILIMGQPVGKFIIAFPFVFILSLIAGIIGGNSTYLLLGSRDRILGPSFGAFNQQHRRCTGMAQGGGKDRVLYQDRPRSPGRGNSL